MKPLMDSTAITIDFNEKYNHAHYDMDDLGNNHDKHPALDVILKIQAFFGVTYCGNSSIFGSTTGPIKRSLLFLYDVSIIILFIVFELQIYCDDSFNSIFQKANNKGV